MWIYIVLMAALVITDQSLKLLAEVFLKGRPPIPILEGIVYLTYNENVGAAFGFFPGQRWLLIGLTSAVLLFLILVHYRGWLFQRDGEGTVLRCRANTVFRWALTLIIAGGLGNLIDRITQGYVADYIDFRWPVDFAIFNFADMCVTFGVILAVIYLFFLGSGERKTPPTATDTLTEESSRP